MSEEADAIVESAADPVAVESGDVLANRWERLGGAMIDSIISIIIVLPVMVVTGILKQTMAGEPMTLNQTVMMAGFGWVVFFILHGYLLFTRGQTIGKVVLNTKIVDLDGKHPPFGKLIALRYVVFGVIAHVPLVGSIIGLLNVLFIFGEEKRCLHDYLAGTRVIKIVPEN